MLTAQFKNETPAFAGDKAATIANIMRDIAEQVLAGHVAGEIYDGVSKERIGTWIIEEEVPHD